MFAEVRRALRPGAAVQVHGLAGDRAVRPTPRLPGPASVVAFVPALADVVQELADAGFVEIAIDTLSARPPFVQAGVPLREIRVSARTPAAPSPAARHRAIYLGPMAQVTDDFGNVYRRGALTAIAARDWDMLAAGPSRGAFLLLGPDVLPLAVTDASCCAPADTR